MSTEPPVHDQTVSLNGLRFHYHEWGDPAAPPLVLLHAYTSHARSWDTLARSLADRFRVLAVDLRQAGQSDDLADTVSYSAVYKLVRRIVEGEPRNLIEAVAEEIAAEILTGFPPVDHVTVTVRKPEAPMKGSMLDAAGVRIARARVDGDERA